MNEIKLDDMSPQKRAEVREFFYQHWRDSNFVRHPKGFSRSGKCGCGWGKEHHGDFCPEHGMLATMTADVPELNPKRMFIDWSPVPRKVSYVPSWDVTVPVPSKGEWVESRVRLQTYEMLDNGVPIPEGVKYSMSREGKYVEIGLGYDVTNNIVFVHFWQVDPRVTKAASGIRTDGRVGLI